MGSENKKWSFTNSNHLEFVRHGVCTEGVEWKFYIEIFPKQMSYCFVACLSCLSWLFYLTYSLANHLSIGQSSQNIWFLSPRVSMSGGGYGSSPCGWACDVMFYTQDNNKVWLLTSSILDYLVQSMQNRHSKVNLDSSTWVLYSDVLSTFHFFLLTEIVDVTQGMILDLFP